MARRRRRRSTWSRIFGATLVKLVRDVQGDFQRAHKAATARPVKDHQPTAEQLVSYEPDWTGLQKPPGVTVQIQRSRRVSRETGNERRKVTTDITLKDYANMPQAERQRIVRASGLCGAPTRDGSPCLNPSGCSIASHRAKKRA